MAKLVNVPNQKQDTYTFEELYEEYWKVLHLRFYGYFKDYHLAEDLAQEAMLRVWKYWDRIDQSKAASVVSVIASRVIVWHLRTEAPKSNITDYTEDMLDYECHDEGILDPVAQLIYEQQHLRTDALVRELLGETNYYVFEQIYFKGDSVESLAKKMKSKPNALYVRLKRIRDRLAYGIIEDSEED